MPFLYAERGTGEAISLGANLLAGKKVPPDITALLTQDHRIVTGWFEWLEMEQRPAIKAMVLRNILNALQAHMAAEEEIFYPEAATATGDQQLIERSLAEHDAAKAIMQTLDALSPGDPDLPRLVTELRAE